MRAIRYKGMWVNSLGIPVKRPERVRKVLQNNRVRKVYSPSFSSNFRKDSPRNLIVIYDVPQEKKKERDWFRRHLKKFDFVMIQKSVWVGPSPLPKDFLEYVKSIGLRKQLETFKLAKPYSEKNNSIN